MTEASVAARLVGQVLDGKYLILRLIGEGGFGAVYAAQDLQLDCRVAIKVLHSAAAPDGSHVAGFLNEVRRVTRLKHPNVVDWKALAQTEDGVCYFVMELLEGQELAQQLHVEKTLPPMRAARILLQILDALRAAHHLPDGECLLHLDLKPSNIFLERHPSRPDQDWVKVIDFGISQFVGSRDEPIAAAPEGVTPAAASGQTIRRPMTRDAERTRDNSHDARSSAGRRSACTPEYAAPEQGAHLLDDQETLPLDERADLYAVGAIGFRMLTGRLPFESTDDYKELLRRKLAFDAPRIASIAPRVPRALARFIDRCLQRNRDDRFRTSLEAYDALNACVQPRFSRRSTLVAASATLLLMLGAWPLLPGRGSNRFELYETRDGHERLLTRNALYLGTAVPSRVLRVAGLRLDAADAIRLLPDPSPEAEPLAGWSATFHSESEVSVEGRVSTPRSRQPAYLEIARGGTRHYSEPFELAWLDASAIAFESIDVPDRNGRRVDAAGEIVQVKVTGSDSDIESVSIEHDANALTAHLDPNRSNDATSVYEFPLSVAKTADAECRLQVKLRDRAGNEKESEVSFTTVSSPLSFAECTLTGAQAVGARFVVPDLSRARLRFKLDGAADVQITALDDRRKAIGGKSLSNVISESVPLAELFPDPQQPQQSFSGHLELVAVDAPYVVRNPGLKRGSATKSLDFSWKPMLPSVSIGVSGADGSRMKEVAPDSCYYAATARIEVHVDRNNVVPVRLEVVVDAKKSGKSLSTTTQTSISPTDRSCVFPLALRDPGPHEIDVRCWQFLDADDPKRIPDSETRFKCLVDDTAPEIRVEAVDSEQESRASGTWPQRVTVTLPDPKRRPDFPPAPVQLRFGLLRADGTALVDERDVGAPLAPGQSTTLTMPVPAAASGDAAIPDGRYVFRLDAINEAGVAASPVSVAVDVARNGPRLQLLRPTAGATWSPDASGNYEIRLLAADPVGLATVSASLSVPEQTPIRVELAAEKPSADASYGEWVGRTRIPRSWMQRPLELRCDGVDRRGVSGMLSTRGEAGSIELAPPACIRVRRSGGELASMRLLHGNATGPYLFGGRADETEERLFKTSGLGTYNRLRTPKSWELCFQAGEIHDYYLDEREATVGDFRRFLADGSGYANPENWPTGSGPDARRRSELEDAIRDLADETPIGNVDWNEACAFARWSGKRLPSFVEWEYAVRGGLQYRATAFAGADPPALSRSSAIGPSPAGSGGDLTPDTKIWNLSGNLAEWSATPVSVPGDDTIETPSSFASKHPLLFLQPSSVERSSEAPSFWVVGGSFRSRQIDFSVADQHPRDFRRPEVGFRCASSLDEVLAALDVERTNHATFKEDSRE